MNLLPLLFSCRRKKPLLLDQSVGTVGEEEVACLLASAFKKCRERKEKRRTKNRGRFHLIEKWLCIVLRI